MVCCTLIAGLLGWPLWLMARFFPFMRKAGGRSLAWRLTTAPPRPTTLLRGSVSRFESFRHASRGILLLVRSEANARIHLIAAILVVDAGLLLGVNASDWRWLAAAVASVMAAEALNTSVERICDRITMEHCNLIKDAKDVAAGAVLITAIAAALIGLLTLYPYIIAHLGAFTENRGFAICGMPSRL